MRLLLLTAFVILISGCETTPPEITYDFETFTAIEAEATEPDPLPDLAPLECYPEDTCLFTGWSRIADIDILEKYKIRAEGNTTIANVNAELVDTMVTREGVILSAAKAQEAITKLREEQLAWERAERRRDKWYYRAMIVLVGAAGVYASQ